MALYRHVGDTAALQAAVVGQLLAGLPDVPDDGTWEQRCTAWAHAARRVLGAADVDYRRYADDIRREYAWVEEADYRAGRRTVLQRFLAKPAIFRLLQPLEAAARRNLAAEIARLEG